MKPVKTYELVKDFQDENQTKLWKLSEPWKNEEYLVSKYSKYTRDSRKFQLFVPRYLGKINLADDFTDPYKTIQLVTRGTSVTNAFERLEYFELPKLKAPKQEDTDILLKDLGFSIAPVKPHTWGIRETGTFKNPVSYHTLLVTLNGKTTTIEYSQGIGIKTLPSLSSVIYCLVSDYTCTDYCDSIDDFANEFGYDSVSECLRVWNAIHEQKGKLASIGFEDVLEQVQEILQDY